MFLNLYLMKSLTFFSLEMIDIFYPVFGYVLKPLLQRLRGLA